MAKPQLKPQDQDAYSDEAAVDARESGTSEPRTWIDPVASPALALQERLNRQFAPLERKFSARFITFLVFGTCAGTWLTGVGLYATL